MKHIAIAIILLSGCAFWQKAAPVIKTIAEIALDQCVATASANEDSLGGMTAAEWCDVGKNFTPFLQAQEQAQLSATGELGMKAQAD